MRLRRSISRSRQTRLRHAHLGSNVSLLARQVQADFPQALSCGEISKEPTLSLLSYKVLSKTYNQLFSYLMDTPWSNESWLAIKIFQTKDKRTYSS